MRRRDFIAGLSGALAWPLAARAQQPSIQVIGFLQAGSEASSADYLGVFRDAMRQLGYIEGRNVRFESRFADGIIERLPELAAELIGLNPSVIVSGPLPANLAVQKATSTIPIVMGTGGDPVEFGLAKSLAHPGANITGISNLAERLAAKQLDVMREILPRLSRVGVLINVTNPLHVPQWHETQLAAGKAGIVLVPYEIREAEQLEAAFAEFTKERVDALLVPPDISFAANHLRIAELASLARLPAVYFSPWQAENGGLVAYGPDVLEGYRRAAAYVDRILKGAKPADLPIEQPTKVMLVINLKTAKALGLVIPSQLVDRADEVIE
jgi:putative ABC transport system substrate-binding protein